MAAPALSLSRPVLESKHLTTIPHLLSKLSFLLQESPWQQPGRGIYNLNLNMFKIRLLIFPPKPAPPQLEISDLASVPYSQIFHTLFTHSQSTNPVDSTLEISPKSNCPLHSHCPALAQCCNTFFPDYCKKTSFLGFFPY